MGLLGSDKPAQGKAQPQSTDEQAIERYRYMLKTAPPETIEQAHAEAFAQLTPEQRRLLLQKLAEGMPASERASAEQGGAGPQALARRRWPAWRRAQKSGNPVPWNACSARRAA
jgi:hypothetical protein